MNWHTPIRYVPLVGPAFEARLGKLEIYTVSDLLFHIPLRYDDYSKITKIGSLKHDEVTTIIASITKVKNIFTRNRKQIQQITLTDTTGTLQLMWFNQPFIIKNLKIGDTLAVAGKATTRGSFWEMIGPEYEIVHPNKSLLHVGRLVPIYPQTAGISSKWLRSRISILLNAPWLQVDYIPADILYNYKLPDILTALKTIHFPNSLSEIEKSRERLAFDELFLLQLTAKIHRQEWRQKQTIPKLTIDAKKVAKFYESLPFTLTQAQLRVVGEIFVDLQKETAMNRLLQGDVGSGKTVVAALAMYMAHLNGYQSLLMAPTEILAQQHYATLSELLKPFKIIVDIVTSNTKHVTRKKNVSHVTSHVSPHILVGTHALLEKSVEFDRLGLVVIDEQHRFGVKQRSLLRSKGKTPHVLSMTATPIPRTLALVFYGDLDFSYIDEMPIGRKPIKTWVVPKAKRDGAYAWIRKQILAVKKTQVFIVCPFIELSETLTTVKAAKEEFEILSKEVFPDLKLGLLHGKMKASEKNEILDQFRAGKFNILVSTPVVEVGIDIPNATIMLIEAADRFGLAQLHQMRGRVGRSHQQSYCLLFAENEVSKTTFRLKNLETCANGRKLAEIDLQLRGAGEVFGTLQHGKELLKIASYSDVELVQKAQKATFDILEKDNLLSAAPLLKERLISSTIGEIAPD